MPKIITGAKVEAKENKDIRETPIHVCMIVCLAVGFVSVMKKNSLTSVLAKMHIILMVYEILDVVFQG